MWVDAVNLLCLADWMRGINATEWVMLESPETEA
jgi:hypothetical protein